ncbi:MAG: helix-turn-helix domain-containing protein [Deltaproteobacteria bacterium]|nr:helix-turn-helix domain-containing protein [Deltaproteobacteria bacterium]
MNEHTQNPVELLIHQIRQAVREEILAATAQNGHARELLTPEQLAERLKVPVSWVYEQSRQGHIPTHRIGRYIRFDLREVMESQKKREATP